MSSNNELKVCNMVSVSGGKDSTATLLLAIERGVENIHPVFADTGNEHELTYEYLDYLERATGVSIQRVKPDFSAQIIRKRDVTMDKWRKDGVSEERIEQVKKLLVPTGNPFLDMCIWKGRFPSSKARFCTEELKVIPITEYAVWPLLKEYDRIESWQGIRWDESRARQSYVEREGIEPDVARVFAYRPILSWTAEQVFDYHRKHGVEWNPLYEHGMGRVGCMPCINANKNEIRAIAGQFPEVIERIAQWEKLVSETTKRGSATFFCATNDSTVKSDDDINYKTHGIRRITSWANTTRGGRQRDLIATDFDDGATCRSVYGLCE
jgi:3'-phosphoadenosine 5'-phosphosulfate sulfotransferase (PAPS reductase)/FAD synthetase